MMTPERRREYERMKAERDVKREAEHKELRKELGLPDDAPMGEFMTVGPDGEVSDLQMHAEILQEDDLLEAAEAQRKRWAARRAEIERERKARRKSRR